MFIYDTWQNCLHYENGEFRIDFSTFIFWTQMYHTWYKPYTYSNSSVWIESVFIQGRVSQTFYLGPTFYFSAKSGNFCDFIVIKSPLLNAIKLKLRPIIMLRHPSLQMGLKHIYSSFQTYMSHNKRDIHVQNIFMENNYYPIPTIFEHQHFSLFYHYIHQ